MAEPAPEAAPPAAPAGEGGDEIVGGPRNPQQIAAQKRLQQTQAQVDEVVDIMRTNVEKVLERDQKLSELDDRADALQQGASQFEQQAGKLKRKFWLQNLKMMIIMGIIGLVIVGIIANKLGLIGGEQPQQPMYMQPPQYMPPPQQAPAGGQGAPAQLVHDSSHNSGIQKNQTENQIIKTQPKILNETSLKQSPKLI